MKKYTVCHLAKLFFLLCLFSIIVLDSFAQTTTINIGSAQQELNPATTFNAWTVQAMSPNMLSAPCYANTTSATGPNPGAVAVGPVGIGQAARVVPGFAGLTNLSCFQFNTIYTPMPVTANYTNCTMTIRRRFIVCSNQNEQINFSFTINCDDGVNSIVLDAGTANSNTLFSGPPTPSINPAYTLNASRSLSPGLHTIDLQVSDYENIFGLGQYFTVNNTPMQWNPFAVAITGNVTSTNSVLLNSDTPAPLTPITGLTSVCTGSTISLANATTGGTWSSSNNSIATINQSGLVTGLSSGNATITYTIGQGICNRFVSLPILIENCGCEDSCNWSLTGNINVKPFFFIGSKNNADFKVRTNNVQRMVVTALGNIGLNTATPTKLLDVNGEAIVRNLPASTPNDKLVLANATGELKSLAPGATNQFLSGNGTWQNLPVTGGTVTNADQGITLEGSTVLLGDYCGNAGGQFRSNREINMENFNLYFNSANTGKVRIGNNIGKERACPDLQSRLELDTRGLNAINEYVTPQPSLSGLRFVDLTANTPTIGNKYKGVLSLDQDGDVIWVDACCNQLGKDNQIASILERLDKLESELKLVKSENTVLKSKLNQSEVTLDYKQNVLEQNVPNPFTETTTIGYTIVNSFSKAAIIFTAANGEIIKSVQLNKASKGQINVSANLVAKGIYTYSLVVDGKLIETKKMIKE